MKLITASCGGLLMAMPVDALKAFYDYRTGVDFESQGTNCGELCRSAVVNEAVT